MTEARRLATKAALVALNRRRLWLAILDHCVSVVIHNDWQKRFGTALKGGAE